jgi:sensor c-di-GMP phosphodiesterase-like protein
MPTENEKTENLIDVGEEQGAEINLDDKGEPEKVEAPAEEKIEVEEVSEVDKTYENERETKLEKKEEKDELKEYSEGVQKRIAKLTRKMREAERQREEAVAYAQSIKSKNDEMEGRISKMDSSYVSEFETRVKTGLAAAKLALKNAIESQDVEAQIAAQQQLAALTMDEARVNSIKVANENKPKVQEREVNITPQQQRMPQQQSDPKAEDWASRNSWFGNDSAMTYTAFDIHKTLVEKEGFDPQSNEYYTEVDRRIRLEFPHKFDKVEDTTTERAKPAQNVASARRSASTSKGRKTVKLSPSQVAIAKRLGVPLEAYAKQLKITEGA